MLKGVLRGLQSCQPVVQKTSDWGLWTGAQDLTCRWLVTASFEDFRSFAKHLEDLPQDLLPIVRKSTIR